MIQVDVQADIKQAMQLLNLLPKEAERAAYRAMNKIADEIKKDSSQQIAAATGITQPKVLERMYVKGAAPGRLIARVGAMPSAKNVGKYAGSNVRPAKSGVAITAWGEQDFYNKAFVMGTQKAVGPTRKVWRRTGPGKDDITDKVYGPSIRKTFEWKPIQKRQLDIIRGRWAYHFERYLRGELVKLGKGDALKGVKNVLPTIQGPTITETP